MYPNEIHKDVAETLTREILLFDDATLFQILARQVHLGTDPDPLQPSAYLAMWLCATKQAHHSIDSYLDSTLQQWLARQLVDERDVTSVMVNAIIESFMLIDRVSLGLCQMYLASQLTAWRHKLSQCRTLGDTDAEFEYLWTLAKASKYLFTREPDRHDLLKTWLSLCDIRNVSELRYSGLGLIGLSGYDSCDWDAPHDGNALSKTGHDTLWASLFRLYGESEHHASETYKKICANAGIEQLRTKTAADNFEEQPDTSAKSKSPTTSQAPIRDNYLRGLHTLVSEPNRHEAIHEH